MPCHAQCGAVQHSHDQPQVVGIGANVAGRRCDASALVLVARQAVGA